MRASKKDRDEALADLRRWIKPGDTVYTVLRHVSRSGMSRRISVVVKAGDGLVHPNWAVSVVCGYRLVTEDGSDALAVSGCGMDMGFAVVNDLSYQLYPEYPCCGERCPSPAHSNMPPCATCGHQQFSHTGESWKPKACELPGCECHLFVYQDAPRGEGVTHKDGYALRQEWL